MLPDTSLLRENAVDGVNLVALLDTINSRVVYLMDRDHSIGHSYFMKVKSVEDLKLVFEDKLIPLLQEYFYGDYNKIGLVLGSGFVEVNEGSPKFADGGFDEDVAEVKTYTLLKPQGAEFIKALNILMNNSNTENEE